MKKTLLLLSLLSTTLLGQPVVRDHVSGRLLVQQRLGANTGRVAQALGSNGAVVVKQIPQLRTFVLQVPEQAADRIAAALERSGEFTVVERDFAARAVSTIPSDTYYPSQWHLAKIQASNAWDLTTGSSAIVVGVIDSGAEATHPDLGPKLVPGWNFLTGSAAIVDNMGHGTAVSGTIGALTNNGAGVAGVAWANPIMPLIVVDASGSASYSDIASAITYAADHGVRIMNISLAGSGASSTLQNAVTYAWNKGSVIFAAAGNYSSSTPMYPAACDYVVAVSATDGNDALSSYSDYGSWIDVAAPGDSILTTNTGASYAAWSGTSFASPVAAGVAALVLSAKPSLSASALVAAIEQNTDDLGNAGFDNSFGYGRVNAYKATLAVNSGAAAGDTTPPTISIAAPTAGATVAGTIQVQGTSGDNIGVVKVDFTVDGQPVSSTTAAAFAFNWNTTSVANGSHTLTVTASDAAGNKNSASVSVTVSNVVVPDTQAPSVAITNPASGSTVNGNVTVSVRASDNVAVTQVAIYIDGVMKANLTAAPYTTQWNAKKAGSGTHTIKATAWDAAGNTNSATINVSVR